MGGNTGTTPRPNKVLGTCRRFTNLHWLKLPLLLDLRRRKYDILVMKYIANKLVALSNSLLVAQARFRHFLRSVIGMIMGSEWAQNGRSVMVK